MAELKVRMIVVAQGLLEILVLLCKILIVGICVSCQLLEVSGELLMGENISCTAKQQRMPSLHCLMDPNASRL